MKACDGSATACAEYPACECGRAWRSRGVSRSAEKLTPREREVLRLVADGLTNKEIAARLYISQGTVKAHCARAFEKIGARRRAHAVRIALETIFAEGAAP